MGQAKQRGSYEERVEQAKSKQVELFTFIAVRHLAGGGEEMFAGKLELGANNISQDEALYNLCGPKVPRWGNNWDRPATFLSAYIPQMQTYKLGKQAGLDALMMEFWDTDPDNPETYSCRNCIGFDSKNFDAMTKIAAEMYNISAATHDIKGPTPIH